MAKVIARNAKIITEGKDLSGQYNNCTLTLSAETPEVTGFGEVAKQRLAGGVTDSELKIDGFYNDSASNTDAMFAELLAASVNVGFFPSGYTACNTGYGILGVLGTYDVKSVIGDACTVSATISGSNRQRIKSLGYTSAASGVTASDVSVNFSSADSNTVYYFVHIMTASTSISACLMHSSDDVTFTTASFLGALTGPGKSYQGTVTSASRYRRLRYTMTGGSGIILSAMSGSSI